MTHTFVELEVPLSMYEFVAVRLSAAGHHQAFVESGDRQALDMHGIALVVEEGSVIKNQADPADEPARKTQEGVEGCMSPGFVTPDIDAAVLAAQVAPTERLFELVGAALVYAGIVASPREVSLVAECLVKGRTLFRDVLGSFE